MSLNGLDDAKVTEAYQGALAEAGGWFLLKYASRDAVEVLTRGTGGAGEARAAVAQYEEKSPLYGFLLYRRRKVLIKYVPEGTSRLLQARVAVHFTAVTEKLTPHDTIISIATADELSDAALTSACSLHTAAPSSCSSSGSSRRHKLDEITEDAEEGQSTEEDTTSVARPTTAASSIPTILEPTTSKSEEKPQEPAAAVEPSKSSESSIDTKGANESKSTPEISHVTIETVTEKEQPEVKTDKNRESFRNYDALFQGGPDPRLSSQTARPTYDELYAEYYAHYTKPKVKLGPRPRPSLDTKRPHTSGNGTASVARPVSSLPPGLRSANRKTTEPKRPKSRETSTVPSIAFPPPPPIPTMPDIPVSPTYPPKSPASVKSMPVPSYSSHHRSTGVTPEKQRLMKALELRKKQLKAKQEKEAKKVVEEPVEDTTGGAQENADGGETTTSPTNPTNAINTSAKPEDGLIVSEHKTEDLIPMQEKSALSDVKSSLPQEDSAVEIVGSQTETDDLNSAASASSPTSAQTQGSSGAPSTRPSSISEDDHPLSREDSKTGAVPDIPSQDAGKSKESLHYEDEKESVESSPTVVPESDTPIPSVEVEFQPDQLSNVDSQPSPSDDASVRASKRASMVLMPPSDQDDLRSRRRSNRESMIFMPSGETSQLDQAQSRRQKRESMILPSSKRHSQFESKEKHKTMLDTFQLSAENSEAEYLSDDSFMEELQSAKVQEAKPVSVSKSPITAFFPRTSSISEISIPERSASQQYNKPGRLSPEQIYGRKSSGPWPPQHANTDTVVVAKKINVSSGISQRIKALAEKSNRDSSASVSPTATPDASTSLVAQRKSSFFSTPPSGNSPNGKTVQRLNRASFINLSNSTTPDRKSVSQPPPIDTDQTVYNVQHGVEKPDSVQVTARIVRDPRVQMPALTMPDEHTPLELHQSPIIIDHQRSSRPRSSSKHAQSPTKIEPTSPRPPSSSHSRDPSSSAVPRSSSESSWRSFGRRLSESRSGGGLPRSQSTHSFESCDEKKEEKKEKKDSRTSKLFKRMSSISSISRKNPGFSPTLPEEEMPTSLPSLREPPPAVQVGDLNIQFPDTLLWKRRWVEIDAMGNLVLSLSKSNEQSKGITKRFHLSEFQTPYAPDQDRQELPNSVILDFLDGRTLQCACETYVAQAQVLQILREAHDAWLAYNQGQ